jgi:uncharacterized repeat protein (TIGR02059 family)
MNGSVNYSVSSVNIYGTTVQLTLQNPIGVGGTLTVSYSKTGVNTLQTAAGGEVESFTAQTSVNIEAPPAEVPVNTGIYFDEASPSIIELYFDLSLTSSVVPTTDDFGVTMNGSTNYNVASVSISGTTVRLTLDNPVNISGTLTVSYSKTGSNTLQTPAGGEVESFTARTDVSFDGPPEEDFSVRIFPFPTGDYLAVHIGGPSITDPHFIRFYDASGELVYQGQLNSNASNIPVSLPPGVYQVDIGLNDQTLYSQKVVLD